MLTDYLHDKRRPFAIIVAVLGLMVWNATPARATVNVLADIYTDEDYQLEDGSALLGGYHAATSDDPESLVCVEGWLQDPNGNTAAYSGIFCDTSSVAAGTEIWLNQSNVVEGQYQGLTYGTDNGSSGSTGGCAIAIGNVSAFIANYQHVSGNTYSRCDTGPCLFLTRISGAAGNPPFLKVFVLRVEAGAFGPAICFGSAPFPIPDCSA